MLQAGVFGGGKRSARRIPVRELVAAEIGAGVEADDLVGQPDLLGGVVDHGVDLAIGDVDAFDSAGIGDERVREREHPAAARRATHDDLVSEVLVRA